MHHTFGKRLREARRRTQLSQADLARKCGIPKPMLSRYENDHILPSMETLKKLSKCLDESVSALVGNGPSTLHTFAAVLGERGILLTTEQDAQNLAGAIADMVEKGDERFSFLTQEEELA